MSKSTASNFFSQFATTIADWSGRPATFVLAVILVLAWAITGPIFNYSETWQLVINTGTTIITFLMVFVLQNSQNRDGKALQAKLDELILTSQAHNKFVGIEKLDEESLRRMSKTLAEEADCIEEVADGKTNARQPV
ncbi:low affinity Fe/Cu permease [Rhizobium sp. ERR 922]|uniref:low affinity iron permease family protein n=1 Tax=Rhizobium TaxID=379 RepID=UPI000DE0950C|nr:MULTISPECIES: low affinity iron permease family protein [Rhizobium]TWB09220.1 low affinity Fe/Cu permease [Rhizobium sp. ERR1071]TWB49068.1 low affinity Fe/Cu permease [Rhizobium sp. ERR 922]TWB91600.1 low affinity Fe/Cu permease [Rhizobium sp. ERR 942]